jgi:threonine/homoserine/homoserine lactone efflux protein
MDYLHGVLFGLLLQLMVGPVCLAVLHTSLQRGFAAAFRMVLGVALVDAFYILVSFTGTAKLLEIGYIRSVMLIAGAIVLIYFGVKYLITAAKTNTDGASSMGNSFVYGIKLTMINPLSIVFWAGTFGTLVASGSVKGVEGMAFFSLGCITATLLFLGGVSLFGH